MENIDFEQVVHAMNLACIAKIRDCVTTTNWTRTAVNKALCDSGLMIDKFMSTTQANELETISFSAIIPFQASEVPGIVAPFYCYVQAEVTFEQELGRHKFHVFFGSKEMKGGKNHDVSYDVELLYHLFYKKDANLDISEFIDSEFAFRYLCRRFNAEDPAVEESGMPLDYEDY